MIKSISIDLLVPFENHPFKKRSGIEQQELTESIKENGLLEPIIVRSFPAGKYEIISGHRRVEACKELGITSIPVIIKELTKDEAIVQMVDSNIHREHILPSEKAFAYKMKSEALKHQGKTYGQVVHKSRDNIFLYLISEKKGAESINREKSLRAKTESAKQRISDLDKLFSRIYEDNILGKLSDERYSRMANEYEAEQKRLISEVKENEKVLIELQKQTVDMKMLYQGLMEFTEMKHLTPTVVNKLIERIEIHNNEKKHSHNNVKVDIYFTAVGLFDIPTEQQIIDTIERAKQKKAEKSA